MQCYYCNKEIIDQSKDAKVELRYLIEDNLFTKKLKTQILFVDRCKKCARIHKMRSTLTTIIFIPVFLASFFTAGLIGGAIIGGLVAVILSWILFAPIQKMMGVKSVDKVEDAQNVKEYLDEGWKVKDVS